ncbi:MAG: hypothetical protein JWN41_1607 [Thermoleophilia bacterium]|nr:hypothetical protein [Thermoleophilia bacterium]
MSDTTTEEALVQYGDGGALAPSIDALGDGMASYWAPPDLYIRQSD